MHPSASTRKKESLNGETERSSGFKNQEGRNESSISSRGRGKWRSIRHIVKAAIESLDSLDLQTNKIEREGMMFLDSDR